MKIVGRDKEMRQSVRREKGERDIEVINE